MARFYYIYAVDYDRGGEWSGRAFMCTRDKEFTIRGTEDCLARGFERAGFFEVDTGEQRSWTVQLTDSGDRRRRRDRCSSITPLIPGPTGGRPTPVRRSRFNRAARADETAAPDQDRGNARSGLVGRAVIEQLFEAGADVFRINMSHTSHDRMRELVAAIRAVEEEHGRPIGILVDLQGPKLRVGSFKEDAVTLVPGADFVLDSDASPGDVHRVQLPHPEISRRARARPHAAARRRQDSPQDRA